MKGINGGLILGMYTYAGFGHMYRGLLGGGNRPGPEDRVRVTFLKHCKGAYWSAAFITYVLYHR
jgi:hypothetical protein